MIRKLLDEYNLEIDDVRWYLSWIMTQRLLSHKEQPEELIKFIWSGKLEAALYNMEEQWIASVNEQLENRTTDETILRDILSQMVRLKRDRS